MMLTIVAAVALASIIGVALLHRRLHTIELSFAKLDYDLEARVAQDAIAHAEQMNTRNMKSHGGKAEMKGEAKMRCAMDYARLHWPSGNPGDAVLRRRIEAELGKRGVSA